MPCFTAWSTGRCAKRTACRSQRARQRQFSPYASGYLLPGKHAFDRFDWEAVSAGTGNVGVRRLQGVVRICRKAAKSAAFFRHISQPYLTPSLCVHWLGVTNQRRVARMKKRSRSHRSQSCCNAKGAKQMETFLGILIPFLGTALDAACVFFGIKEKLRCYEFAERRYP